VSAIKPEWLAHQQRRFMRPDAQRFVREDAARFFRPGFSPGQIFERKAGFDPNQQRDEFGRWTDTGAGDVSESNPFELPLITVTADSDSSFDTELGEWLFDLFEDDEVRWLAGEHDNSDRWPRFHFTSNSTSNYEPPKIPSRRPPSRRQVNAFLKAAARWIAKAGKDPRVKTFILLYEAMSWLDIDRYYIEAYRDPPKSLEDLRASIGQSKWGYNTHHIVEQTPAEKEGYPRSLIDGRENLVSIPALKHWEITGWYATKTEEYGGLSPREYLRDKSWDEKTRVGLEALKRFGVLAR